MDEKTERVEDTCITPVMDKIFDDIKSMNKSEGGLSLVYGTLACGPNPYPWDYHLYVIGRQNGSIKGLLRRLKMSPLLILSQRPNSDETLVSFDRSLESAVTKHLDEYAKRVPDVKIVILDDLRLHPYKFEKYSTYRFLR